MVFYRTLNVEWIVEHIEMFIIVMILYFYPGFKHGTLYHMLHFIKPFAYIFVYRT